MDRGWLGSEEVLNYFNPFGDVMPQHFRYAISNGRYSTAVSATPKAQLLCNQQF